MPEIKAEFPIGKTQWAKWGPEARETFNKCCQLGYNLTTAANKANGVQAKVRSAALEELAQLGQEQEAPVQAETVKPAPTPKKTTAPKRKAK